MSAAELREAAALIRQRAEAATPGRWIPFGNSIGAEVDGCTCHGGIAPYGHEQYCGVEGPVVQAHETDIQHIASWRPAVALAVAELLEAEAAAGPCEGDAEWRASVNLARAYLGRES